MVVKELEKSLVETPQGIFLPVHVTPLGKNFAVLGFDEWNQALKVRLSKKPERGKANQELVENLRTIFGADVEIAKGEKSQRKTLLVHASKKSVLESLSRL